MSMNYLTIKPLSKSIFMLSGAILAAGIWLAAATAQAREAEYQGSEMPVYMIPGEPTEVVFPGKISGGFKKKLSALSVERKDESLILFAGENLPPNGEALIVRLDDGRSYSLRAVRASAGNARDAILNIKDERGALVAGAAEDEPPYREKTFKYAPPSAVSGLLREMVLVAELGKQNIAGYKMNDAYRGQKVLDDGTLVATIDRIFIGPNLWGYVLDAQNLLEQTHKINPASFRLDGTRAVSARQWELAARPLNIEQQISGADKTKVYIITRARKGR